MRTTIVAALAASTLLVGASASANAASLLTPLVATTSDAPQITLVREGCGFGGHRGFYGGCRANFGPRGAVFAARHGRYGYFARRGYY